MMSTTLMMRTMLLPLMRFSWNRGIQTPPLDVDDNGRGNDDSVDVSVVVAAADDENDAAVAAAAYVYDDDGYDDELPVPDVPFAGGGLVVVGSVFSVDKFYVIYHHIPDLLDNP